VAQLTSSPATTVNIRVMPVVALIVPPPSKNFAIFSKHLSISMTRVRGTADPASLREDYSGVIIIHHLVSGRDCDDGGDVPGDSEDVILPRGHAPGDGSTLGGQPRSGLAWWLPTLGVLWQRSAASSHTLSLPRMVPPMYTCQKPVRCKAGEKPDCSPMICNGSDKIRRQSRRKS
jgi:hypothetical protein